MHKLTLLTTLLFFSSACMTDEPASSDCASGKCDPTDSVEDECTDPGYGDGQCDLELSCAAPDIDCFVTFENDAEAAAWFNGIEAWMAMGEVREPRALLDTSDPRYPAMRELLDRGWDSFKDTYPVGALGDLRIGLVLIEDPTVNAFVVPTMSLDKVGLLVVVHSGLLDGGGTDAELMGLVMHELQHAIGLHVIPARKEAIKRYYQVLAGDAEPLGAEQPDDPAVRQALELLISVGEEVGLQPLPELNGLPFFTGQLFKMLQLVQQSGSAHAPEACGDAEAGFELFTEFLGEHYQALDSSVALGDDGDEFAYVTAEYIQTLHDDCLAESTASFYDVLAFQVGVTVAKIKASASDEDRALVDGKHIVDALLAVGFDRYAKIDAVEATLQEKTGSGIDSLRYFTTEEAADNVTVPILGNADIASDGFADFFLNRLMSPEDRDECLAILEAGEVPPYGTDLVDDHHATCWRVWNVRRLAAGARQSARLIPRAPRPELERTLRALNTGSEWPSVDRYTDHIPDCFGNGH